MSRELEVGRELAPDMGLDMGPELSLNLAVKLRLTIQFGPLCAEESLHQ